MLNSSQIIKNECCGNLLNSCSKTDLVSQVAKLEREKQELQDRIDTAISNQELNREAFAHKCFNAGMRSVEVRAGSTYCDIKHWLNFKTLEL